MVWPFSSSEPKAEQGVEETRGGYNCAPYTVLETAQEYQVRVYPSRKWATVVYEREEGDVHSTNPMTRNWKEQKPNKSFMKLFGYITGANEEGAKISMTVPVSTMVTTVEEEGSKVTREEMGFYVPEEQQGETPQPKGEVKIVTRPEMTVFVRTFGGFAKDGDWEEQKRLLLASLESHSDYGNIDTGVTFRQGYDAPFKFWGRKNEVFVVKKGAKDEEQKE